MATVDDYSTPGVSRPPEPGQGPGDAGAIAETERARLAARPRMDEAGEAPRRSTFWPDPDALREKDLIWYDPPVPIRQNRLAQAEGLLDRLGQLLGERSPRAWLLRWTFHERTSAAAAEMEDVEAEAHAELALRRGYADADRAELDSLTQDLHALRRETERQLHVAHDDFAQAAGAAGLACTAEGVTPARVQEVLLDTAPGLDEFAGAQGIGPVEDHRWTVGGAFKAFFLFLAPWVAGFMLALCLGTLVGLLDLAVLRQPDQNRFSLLVAAVLGFVIVYLMGEVVSAAVTTLTRRQESAASAECPRYRSGGVAAAALLIAAALLVSAEITAETFGIRQLHQQHIIAMRRTEAMRAGGTNIPEDEGARTLPIVVYALMGLLISGPYIAYKSSRAWSDGESRMREAWLLKLQRDWVDRKWETEPVQRAYHLAHQIQRREAEIKAMDARLKEARADRTALLEVELPPKLTARRNAARAAAVGEAARLHQMVDEIVEEHEGKPPVSIDTSIPRDAVQGPVFPATSAAPGPDGLERA